MQSGWYGDVALLVLRLSVAYVFLYAAWKNTESAAAWQWTVGETGLLFQSLPEQTAKTLALYASLAGMVMMYGGGISILVGIEPRLGGLAIAAFSLMGMRIHHIHRDQAWKAAQAGDPMGWSAYSAHIAAGLKNWALAGAGVVFLLVGAGPRPYSLAIDYFGRITGLG